MVKLEFNKEKDEWEILPKGTRNRGIYLDGKLKEKLDNIRMIIEKNWDAVFMVDGVERIGKSTLGLTCAYYLTDAKLTINNVCIGATDAIDKLEKLPDKSLLLIDEGSLVFSSTDVMKKENKQLNKVLNVIGQKNMILIIISPSFFNLSKYISVERSRFLLHCYADKELNRGRFAYFSTNKKRALYEIGKKNFNSYRKPQSDFIGVFRDFNPLGDEYLELKKKSLMEALREPERPISQKIKVSWRRELVKRNLESEEKIKTIQLANLFGVSKKTIHADMAWLKNNN